jgi:FdhD protein
VLVPKGATKKVPVIRRRDGQLESARDILAVEEPLEIRVAAPTAGGGSLVEPLAVTMRTPGSDFELVAGFLHGEGIVRRTDDLSELSYCRGSDEQDYNVVEARLAPGVAFDLEVFRRNVYTTSSCGVCGVASLEALEARGCEPVREGPTIDGALVARLPDLLREAQGVFERTGGLHAAGLFGPGGERRAVMEDVGRHNAVDKVVGHALLARALPATDATLVVSGRASFELVQKAVMAGIPILVAVGAPSSLAVDVARRFGQTLVGFARDGGYNVYAGEERIG